MRKTSSAIEQDIYNLLKGTAIASTIKGSLCIGSRLFDSDNEDAVIAFLTGLDGDIQRGVVNLNVYVPDITVQDKYKYKDFARCLELEQSIVSSIESLQPSDYYLSITDTIQTYQVEDKEEHFINARLNFKRKI